MDLKICLKKLLRTPVKTLLFFFLLTVTGALLSLCVSLLLSANDTNKKAQEIFTTIAIPNSEKIKYDSVDQSKNLNNLKEEDFAESVSLMNKLYYKVLEQASDTEIAKVDLHNSYLAYSNNLTALRLYDGIWNEWSISHNMAVLELECMDFRPIKYDKNLKAADPDIEDIIVVVWKINNVLSLHPHYNIPDTLEIYTTESEMDARGLFEIGKRYLVAGYIKDFGSYSGRIVYFNEANNENINFDNDFNVVTNQKWEGYFNSYIELTEDVDVFLNSSEGAKYKKLIENCKFINESANIISVDNINAIPHFNQKNAFVIDGREITAEEYNQGKNVCVISWQYAALNELNVGDEINLSLANGKYGYALSSNVLKTSLNRRASTRPFPSSSSITGEALWFLRENPYMPINYKEQSFEIVGIYQPPEFGILEFMLSPNTIYVPKKSVDLSTIEENDVAMQYFNQIPTSLYSLIIPNDRFDEFKAELAEKGIDKYFIYYDQGYSAVKNVLKIMAQNALIILAVGFIIWILVLIFFILLYIVREKKVAGIMLSLGIGAKRAFLHLLISCMLLAIPSTIMGGVISGVLEDKVINISYNMAIDQVTKGTFDKTFSVNANSGYNFLNEENNGEIISSKDGYVFVTEFVQLIIILCVSSIFIYVMLRKNPMELVKSKE